MSNDDGIEPTDEEIITKAMLAAMKAYDKTMSDEGVDAAYYPINLEVNLLDDDFTFAIRKLKMINWIPPERKNED